MQLHADEGCINKTSSAWMLNKEYQWPVLVADAFSIFSIADSSMCSFLGASSECKENGKSIFLG